MFMLYTFNAYDGETQTQPPVVPPVEKPPVIFKQEDVDRIVAEARRKDQEKLSKTTAELSKLQQATGLTAQEKADLEARLADLNDQYKTKEQLAAQELEKQQSTFKLSLESTSAERDRWKSSFESTSIDNAIVRTVSSDAINVEQLQDLLKPKSRLVENKETGTFAVMVKVTVLDKKTKSPITLDLPIDEAVKQMKDCPERYGNLFKSTVSGGLGGGGGGKPKLTGGKLTNEDFETMSVEDYAAWRKTNNPNRRS